MDTIQLILKQKARRLYEANCMKCCASPIRSENMVTMETTSYLMLFSPQ